MTTGLHACIRMARSKGLAYARLPGILLWILTALLTASPVYAQQFCTTGKLVYKEDFGGNSHADPHYAVNNLGNKVPGYRYVRKYPVDGEYVLAKSGRSFHNFTYKSGDHTYPGDDNRGYALWINADWKPGIMYRSVINDICAGTIVSFSAWMISVSNCRIKPDITFLIYDATTSRLINEVSTGSITQHNVWKQYGMSITVPAGTTSLRMEMRNNAPGGCGNDVAIDDIEVRLCGPDVKTTQQQVTVCTGESFTLEGTFSNKYNGNTLFQVPYYQWQSKQNGQWQSIPGATRPSYTGALTPADRGQKEFRLLVAGQPVNTVPVNCVLESAPIGVKEATYSFTLTADSAVIHEGSTVTFTLAADKPLHTNLELPVILGGNLANYTVRGLQDRRPPTLYTARISAGQSAIKFTIDTEKDNYLDVEKTLTARLGNISGPCIGSLQQTPVSIRIKDGDALAPDNTTLVIERLSHAAEPAVNGRFRVGFRNRAISASAPVKVNLQTGGTAAAGADYLRLPGDVTIPADSNGVVLDVKVLDDSEIEVDETVTVTLSAVNQPIAGITLRADPQPATVYIYDDDSGQSNLTVGVEKVTNGREGAQDGAFRVFLPQNISVGIPVTVKFTITGTATNGADYRRLPGSVVIPAGSNSVPVNIAVTDDNIIEGNETVILTLISGTAAGLHFGIDNNARSAILSIEDNDHLGGLALKVMKIADGGEPAVNGAFRIGFEGGVIAAQAVRVFYTLSGAALNGVDFAHLPGEIVIPAGDSAVEVAVNVIDDKVIEGDETVRLSIDYGISASSRFVASGTAGTAVLLIHDDDVAALNDVLYVRKLADAAEPDIDGVFRVGFQGGYTASAAVRVFYDVSGTAAPNADYHRLPASVLIPQGDTSVDIPVTVLDDNLIEGDETVILRLRNATGGGLNYRPAAGYESATMAIADDDAARSALLLQVRQAADAREPGRNGAFMISFAGGVSSAEDVTVRFYLGGTAGNGVDFVLLPDTIVIPAHRQSIPVFIRVIDDKIIEGTETLTLTLIGGRSGPTQYNVDPGAGTAQINIEDDDITDFNRRLLIKEVMNGAEPDTDGSCSIAFQPGITVAAPVTVYYTLAGTADNGIDFKTLPGQVIIPAGDNMVNVPVQVKDDLIIEGDETVDITLTGGNSNIVDFNADMSQGRHTLVIHDNDTLASAGILYVRKVRDAAEPDTKGIFRIGFKNGYTASDPVRINCQIGGSATPGIDYQRLSSTTLIPAGNSSIDIAVHVIDDQLAESDETITLTLIDGSDGKFRYLPDPEARTALMTIDDDDVAGVLLSVQRITDGQEPSANGAFRVSLPAGFTSAQPVKVVYEVRGDADEGLDYQVLPDTIVIPAHSSHATVFIRVLDDHIIEGDEAVDITLRSAFSGNLQYGINPQAARARVLIGDDDNIDANRRLLVKAVRYGSEPDNNGDFTISLPGRITAASDITITYQVSGTATAGSDYAALPGTVILPAGQHSVLVPVTVLDDDIIEGDETVILTLRNGTSDKFRFTIDPALASGTMMIRDDDNVPGSLVAGVIRVADAAEPSTPGVFRIALPPASKFATAVEVAYTVSGTATPGLDYNALSGVAMIPPGESSIDIYVNPVPDGIIEGDETVTLTLTGARTNVFALALDTAHTAADIIITDEHDKPENYVLSAAVVTNAAEPSGNGLFRISLPQNLAASADITVRYDVSGTATAGLDYTALSGTVTIPAGANSADITVYVLDDHIIEGDESVKLEINEGNMGNVRFAPHQYNGSAELLIKDKDATTGNMVLAITGVRNGSENGTPGLCRIALPGNLVASAPVNVAYLVSGTAGQGADFDSLPGMMVIPAGANSADVIINVKDDLIIEGTETVTLTLVGGDAGGMHFRPDNSFRQATITIADNDSIPANLALQVKEVTGAAEPNRNGAFAIGFRDNISAAVDVTVDYTITGRAQPDLDYRRLPGTVTIPAGTNSIQLPVEVIDDNIVEGDEMVTLTITGIHAAGFTFVPDANLGAGTVVITDDDVAAAHFMLGVNTLDNGAEPAKKGIFRIALTGNVTFADTVVVTYDIQGTASPGLDYIALPGTAHILPGSGFVDVDVHVINDRILEGDETVIMTLTGGSAGIFGFTFDPAHRRDTLKIVDNDGAFSDLRLGVSTVGNAAEPAQNGAFQVNMPAGLTAAGPVTVYYHISGTAAAGADYVNIPGSAVIPAGAGSVLIPVTVIDDKIMEEQETVTLTLTGGVMSGFRFGVDSLYRQADVIIDDDDNIAANRMLGVRQVVNGAEPATDGSFFIALPDGYAAVKEIDVSYDISGTALPGADYEALTGRVRIPALQNGVVLPVRINDDRIIEGDETVVLNIQGGTTGNFYFAPDAIAGTGILTIADDDMQPANLAVHIRKVADAFEGGNAGIFRIALPAGITAALPATVTYSVSGSATQGVDYPLLPGKAVIPAGQNNIDIHIVATDDQVIEQDEEVELTLQGAATATTAFGIDLSRNKATIQIIDNDAGPANRVLGVRSVTDGSETGVPASFTIGLLNGLITSDSIAVQVRVSGTAEQGVDYDSLAAWYYILPGENSVRIAVKIKDDDIIEGRESITLTVVRGRSASGRFTPDPFAESGTAWIDDDDRVQSNLVLSVRTGANGAEPAGQGVFRVRLRNNVTAAFPVLAFYHLSGTALEGVDYEPLPDTIIIPPGQNSVSVKVKVKDDYIIEGNETVILTLTGGQVDATDMTVHPQFAEARMVIADDDNAPASYRVQVKQTVNGAEAGNNGSVVIGLPDSLVFPAPVTVHYRITGTASSGLDYQAPAATVEIPAGENNVTLNLHIIDDKIIEEDETIIIELTGAQSGNTLFAPDSTSAVGVITILDDDYRAFSKLLSVRKLQDAREPATDGVFRIAFPDTLTASKPVTVSWTISGSAQADADYQSLPPTVVIPAGVNYVDVLVKVIDDKIIEPDETVIAVLTGTDEPFAGFSVTVNEQPDTVYLLDDENRYASRHIILEKAAGMERAKEPDGVAAFTIRFADTLLTCAEDVVVMYSTGGSAQAGIDYDALTGSAIIKAGEKQTSVDIRVRRDSIAEPAETVVAELLSAVTAADGILLSVAGKDTVVIEDEYPALTLKIVNLSNAAEPGLDGSFRISYSESDVIYMSEDVRVTYQVAGSATNGKDYTYLPGEIIIPAGSNGVTLPVHVLDDRQIELTETLRISLLKAYHNMPGVMVEAIDTAEMLIYDDDGADTAAAAIIVSRVADGAEGGPAGRFRIGFRDKSLTAPADLHITYTAGGDAIAGEDYEALSGTAVLPAGQNSIWLDVVVNDDKLAELTEQVTIRLVDVWSAAQGLLLHITPGVEDMAAVSIVDNDLLELRFRPFRMEIQEGDTAMFAVDVVNDVEIGAPLRFGLSVKYDKDRYYSMGGIALPAGDTMMWMEGGRQMMLKIAVQNNNVHDEDGFVSLEFIPYWDPGTLSYTFREGAQHTVKIKDDDPLTIQWEEAVVNRAEGNSGRMEPMYLVLAMNRPCSKEVKVNYEFMEVPGLNPFQRATPRSATAGEDLQLIDYDDRKEEAVHTVRFLPGQTRDTITIMIMADTLFEADEHFQVAARKGQITLSNGTVREIPLEQPYLRAGILNDDAYICNGDYDNDGIPNWKEAGYEHLLDCERSADEGRAVPMPDTDGDGIPDYLDSDSDDDGVPDSREAWSTDDRQIDGNKGQVRVHKSVSPNRDGKGNDCMYIENIEKYPDNEVMLFNRWGNVVYRARQYNNRSVAFCGYANVNGANGKEVADGVYYYVISIAAENGDRRSYKGYIIVKR